MKLLFFLIFMAVIVNAQASGFEAKINQLGYGESAKKILVYKNINAQSVEFRDLANGKAVLNVPLSAAAVWEYSGEPVRKADFSAITKPGLYAAYINGERVSDNIVVQNSVYENMFKASLKWFYYQRASTALSPEFAGKWARAAGHPDTSVGFYPESGKPAGWKMSSPKGWYDAGDYGKYIVNSGISVFTILQLYEHFETQLKKISSNIPESKSNMPDILEEVRWNLDWMLTMQDSDGGVYHKLTTARFSGHELPDADIAKRYVVMKTTPATLNFAAVMAQASRIYKPFDQKFSQTALKAAESAYDWAIKNPLVLFKQPDGMNTGQYNPGDETAKDEFLWAATELYISTKKKSYADRIDSIPFNSHGPWWGNVNFLAVYRLANAKNGFKKELTSAAQDSLLELANFLKSTTENSAYGLPVTQWNFVWGSNSAVANNGIVLLHAYYLKKDKSYLDAAQRALDYLLGANPLGISFVTGYGNRTPMFPHHRPSEGDGIIEPVPGMLAGGPHEGGQDIKPNGRCDDYLKKGKPALCYADNDCSYATNEVAINWNAPLVYLSGALHFLNNKSAIVSTD
ncbi:MAG: glycoside hydrolase family 9 protein [Fibromonadaceae bacterium]|jgi:endoglucanase|nr:glycoside hydrolase family 9 protein [Fibromonadaceae bacterium]